MIGLHKNVFNILANQKTAFISSRKRENIGKKEVKFSSSQKQHEQDGGLGASCCLCA